MASLQLSLARLVAGSPFSQSSKAREFLRRYSRSCQQSTSTELYSAMSHVDAGQSFFVADLSQVRKQYMLWNSHLPQIRPFYAVKCNPDPMLLSCLRHLGAGFDCASIDEIRRVQAMGVDPSNIIFANPCKAPKAVVFAAQSGIKWTTFDNLSELDKIKEYWPEAGLFLRIYANDPTAIVQLGNKFGAPLGNATRLLERARVLGLRVVGISFHVGSGASDPLAFRTAIERSKQIWDIAKSLGMDMRFLDIGGGFQTNPAAFALMAGVIKRTISEVGFPHDVGLLAEPSHFFTEAAYNLIYQIISLRHNFESDSMQGVGAGMIYQNDGVYKHFMNRLVEGAEYAPTILRIQTKDKSLPGSYEYSIWGPTCDGTDCIAQKVKLPLGVETGDLLLYQRMGAYTMSTTTQFNGFSGSSRVFYMSPAEVATFLQHAISHDGKDKNAT